MSLKLHKVLTVAGTVVPLVKDDVRLDLRSPGRASFTVRSAEALSGLVIFDLGYNDRPLQRFFIGFVERSTQVNSVEQLLSCRELTAILNSPLPLNLRHVDLHDVLGAISERTGLRFRVPDQAYARAKAPYFYNLATGIQAMDSLARIYNIPDPIWQQQGDGEVFVGSWADSYFGAREVLQLPIELFNGYQDNQSAMIAALPGVRPGAMINQEQRVMSVSLSADQMALRWKKQ